MRTGPVRARGTPPGTATKIAEPPPRALETLRSAPAGTIRNLSGSNQHELRRRSTPSRPDPSGSSDLRRPGARARGAGAVRAAMRPAPALDRRRRGPDRAGGCRPYPERGGAGGRGVADRLARRDARGGARRGPGAETLARLDGKLEKAIAETRAVLAERWRN